MAAKRGAAENRERTLKTAIKIAIDKYGLWQDKSAAAHIMFGALNEAINQVYGDAQMRDELKERRLKLMGKITQPTIPHAEAEQIAAEIATLESDMSFLSSMISDREYDIEWMETGRRPGNKRGIERRAAYQRERPVDPLKLQAYVAKSCSGGAVQAERITDRERDRIEFALGQLSPREKECKIGRRKS
ncbi:hypothetical protein NDS46_10100 [Paenibacillus thiaminolyticus]|uniref:hypothetical protein n=1 Tax=Paenibacillus thiaminolyticus TaxID=49283 RepID=UPI00232B0AB4|nr:hypothetical protein [Paenibacillus thiaminolyticus]WCF10168.1 hypothetical protein NDS46_10100 [Paenibacillus thiaminolyticus]